MYQLESIDDPTLESIRNPLISGMYQLESIDDPTLESKWATSHTFSHSQDTENPNSFVLLELGFSRYPRGFELSYYLSGNNNIFKNHWRNYWRALIQAVPKTGERLLF